MNDVAKRVHFSGHVQGVGFRYTTLQIAQQYPIIGWVRNLRDGRVEIQVKGSAHAVDEFLNHICKNSRLVDLIHNIDESPMETTSLDEFDDFSIRG